MTGGGTGYYASTASVTDNSGSRTSTSLDTEDFETYSIVDSYLRDSYTNPTVSSIALIPSTYVYWLDGSTNSISMSSSFTRTFTNSYGSISCTDTTSSWNLIDHNGNSITDDTTPWWFENDTLNFRSTDERLEGIYFWSSIGATFYLLPVGADEPDIDISGGIESLLEQEKLDLDLLRETSAEDIFSIPPLPELSYANDAMETFMQALQYNPANYMPSNLAQSEAN
jgi:hypothetical protein